MRNDHAPVAPIRLRHLLWVPALAALWLASELYGTPHMLITYTYIRKAKQPYYLSCDYWGLHPFQVKPLNGACPLFLLARTGEAR